MKPKIRWKSLSEVFLLLILCWGCEHDYFIEPSGFIATNSGTALEQARDWYASQGYNRTVWLYPETKAQNGILFYSEPSWKYYSETENQRYAAIDVALTDRIRLDFVPHENLDCYRQTGNYHYRRSYTRLVILTDKMNGRKLGFLMTFIPSGKYTEKYLNRLGKTTYLQRDERLDGLVLFHNLNGSFSNGWRYTDGRVSGAVPEMIHAIQDLKFYGRNHMNACRKNVEFEAKVFQDLATELKGEGGWKIGSANQSKEFMAEYNKWIDTFINNRNINLFISRFNEFCSSWTGYAGNYQESFVPEVLMSYFK